MTGMASAYNPLQATKRMEAAGLPRTQAEAIAFEITDGTSELVTDAKLKDALEAAINRGVIRSAIMTSAIVAAATTVLGLIISLK